MTPERVTALAQTDPLPSIVARWGEAVAEARKRADHLADSLRDLDKIQAQLAERKLDVSADLGGPGNAFQHARRADLADKSTPVFAMPTKVA